MIKTIEDRFDTHAVKIQSSDFDGRKGFLLDNCVYDALIKMASTGNKNAAAFFELINSDKYALILPPVVANEALTRPSDKDKLAPELYRNFTILVRTKNEVDFEASDYHKIYKIQYSYFESILVKISEAFKLDFTKNSYDEIINILGKKHKVCPQRTHSSLNSEYLRCNLPNLDICGVNDQIKFVKINNRKLSIDDSIVVSQLIESKIKDHESTLYGLGRIEESFIYYILSIPYLRVGGDEVFPLSPPTSSTKNRSKRLINDFMYIYTAMDKSIIFLTSDRGLHVRASLVFNRYKCPAKCYRFNADKFIKRFD